MRKLWTRKTLALAAVALAVAGGGGAAIASSQANAASPSSFLDAVARHLGVSREELDDAAKAAALEQVDAAREAGRITEEQADALKARIESGLGPPLLGPFFGGFHHRMHGPGSELSAAADYLDLSLAQVRDRLGRGQSLADVADGQGKSVDGLKDALVAAAEQRLDEAVDDGFLTEAQAEAMLDRLRSRIDALVDGELPRWHGHGGPPPFRWH
jgi:hypothetical protein